MWILRDAIFHNTSMSFANSCDLPLINAGINNSADETAAKSSFNVNPLFDSIWSTGMWYLLVVKHDSVAICICDALPPYHFDM